LVLVAAVEQATTVVVRLVATPCFLPTHLLVVGMVLGEAVLVELLVEMVVLVVVVQELVLQQAVQETPLLHHLLKEIMAGRAIIVALTMVPVVEVEQVQ
jgi:hypothetical protein